MRHDHHDHRTSPKPCGHRMWCACALVAVLVTATACASDSSPLAESRPSVAVTTSVWADMVDEIDCHDRLELATLLAPGQDPHLFRPSAQTRRTVADANVVVANGYGLEGDLALVVRDAEQEGQTVLELSTYIDNPLIGSAEHDHDHDDEVEAHDDHDDDDDGHGHDDEVEAHDDHDDDHDEADGEEAFDPHFWLDPIRVADGLGDFADDLEQATGLEDGALACVDSYAQELRDIDAGIRSQLVGTTDRTVITNHEVLGYFADRYSIDVESVLLSTSSDDGSAARLRELGERLDQLVAQRDSVGILVAETENIDLAEDLATTHPTVEIVPLALESLGAAGSATDTYLGMLRALGEAVTDQLR